MGKARVSVRFESSFPPEQGFDDKGALLPDGQKLSRAIVRRLIEKGFQVSLPIRHRFYGWKFVVFLDDSVAHVVVQNAEPWLLVAERKFSLWRWVRKLFRKPVQQFPGLVEALHHVLHADERFFAVRWKGRAGTRGGGSAQAAAPRPRPKTGA